MQAPHIYDAKKKVYSVRNSINILGPFVCGLEVLAVSILCASVCVYGFLGLTGFARLRWKLWGLCLSYTPRRSSGEF